MSTFAPLVAPLGVPLRGDGQVRYVGAFFGEPGVVDHDRMREPLLLKVLGELTPRGGLGELGCHPGG